MPNPHTPPRCRTTPHHRQPLMGPLLQLHMPLLPQCCIHIRLPDMVLHTARHPAAQDVADRAPHHQDPARQGRALSMQGGAEPHRRGHNNDIGQQYATRVAPSSGGAGPSHRAQNRGPLGWRLTLFKPQTLKRELQDGTHTTTKWSLFWNRGWQLSMARWRESLVEYLAYYQKSQS
jgi:hypothetical protein